MSGGSGNDVFAALINGWSGDGITDLEIKSDKSDIFIGYGGVIVRKVIITDSDWFVYDFNEIAEIFKNSRNK